MQDFLRTYGRALDISGAFAFSALFFGCFAWGFNIFALAFAMGAVAFFSSWRHWTAYDWSEARYHQTMCAIFGALSLVLFILAIVFEVLA